MAANTRPYFLTYNGENRMVEAANPAAAVRHVVGAAVTELRPARGAEVAAWVRADKRIEIAGEQAATAAAATEATTAADPAVIDDSTMALAIFEDWAGFENGGSNTASAAAAMLMFSHMSPAGQMDLMTFDTLRQQAPEFGFAIMAREIGIPRGEDDVYVQALNSAEKAGIAQVRAALEERPMPFADVVTAVLRHAGKDTVIGVVVDPDDVGEEPRDNGGVLANGQ